MIYSACLFYLNVIKAVFLYFYYLEILKNFFVYNKRKKTNKLLKKSFPEFCYKIPSCFVRPLIRLDF